LIDVE